MCSWRVCPEQIHNEQPIKLPSSLELPCNFWELSVRKAYLPWVQLKNDSSAKRKFAWLNHKDTKTMITSPIWACLCLIILRIGAKPSFEGPVEISELFGSPEDRVEEVFDDEPEEPDQVLDRTVVRVDENFQNCSDFAVDGYRCVSYDQCVDGEILTSGAGLIDVRNGFLEPEVSHCPSYLEVCCRLATHFGQPLRPRPKPPVSFPLYQL